MELTSYRDPRVIKSHQDVAFKISDRFFRSLSYLSPVLKVIFEKSWLICNSPQLCKPLGFYSNVDGLANLTI